jgi:acetylornithine deacetylase/succinyl-diaminopimelate desuccinylase-like protein
MASVTNVLERAASQRDRYVEELLEFLRIPSISTDSKHKADVARCAEFVAEKLRAAGAEARVFPTDGHPIVYGEIRAATAKAPTVLVYGHYDVQPADPLDLWKTPPFEPRIANGNVYARGAADDKGQVYTHVKAVEAYREAGAPLPVNVKFLIEGEEEVSSTHLEGFLKSEKKRLACDVIVISDTDQFAPGVPAITYALRGIMYMEVRVDGPDHDLHSGMFGGSVMNPAAALAAILASLKDGGGRILIPGFYDDVVPLDDWEREMWAKLPFDEEEWRGLAGSPKLAGERGFTTLERKWARPTVEINGIYGGYQGEGAKTIIPAWAGAKVSMRLVANQTPERAAQLFERAVQDRCPPGVRVTTKRLSGGMPVLVAVDSPAVRAASRAIERGFGKAPVFVRSGGSIPVVGSFKQILGVDSLLLGWGRPDDNIHSPNEKFHLGDYQKGIETSAILLEELAKT